MKNDAHCTMSDDRLREREAEKPPGKVWGNVISTADQVLCESVKSLLNGIMWWFLAANEFPTLCCVNIDTSSACI